MLVIVDYGVGNLGSLLNMCKYIGVDAQLGNTKEQILSASHLLLPGVGAFDKGMNSLNESGLIDALNEAVLQRKIPVLGICLGMHMMTSRSEEGTLPGLKWIDASVKRICTNGEVKVPHMGWSRLDISVDSKIFSMTEKDSRYYFVHSYCVKCKNEDDSAAQVVYGERFDVAFERENIFGVQFHPEKSHHFGMQILKNFINS